MMQNLWRSAILATFLLLPWPPILLAQPVAQPTLALVGGRLVDGFGGPPLENSVILISGEEITAVGIEGVLAVPPGVQLIDTNGMTVLPGIWESHGHLFHLAEGNPTEFQTDWAAEKIEVMAMAARVNLMAGVTTFRDTGGPLEEQLELRRQIREGKRPGPRLFLAGPILRQRNKGDDRTPGDFTVSTPAEARETTQQVVDMGADQIKVYGFWDLEVLRAVTETAHKNGLGVDADVRHIRAYRTAIEAGVDRLHHVFTADPLSDYSEEDLRLLIRGVRPIASGPSANILRGPYIVPTIEMRQSYARAFRFPEIVEHPRLREEYGDRMVDYLQKTWSNIFAIPWGIGAIERVKVAKEKLRHFIEIGGREQIVAGCDTGSPLNFHPAVMRELANLREAGLTPMETIQAATLRPAQMQGVDDRLGTVSPGKLADMIVVDGDPLQDIRLLQHEVAHVIKGGKLIR